MVTDTHARYRSVALSEVRPSGWILAFLRRQCEGITGHPEASGYPFDHAFWSDPAELPRVSDESMMWWPYEQTGYWVEAALKAGYLAGDDRVFGMALSQIDQAIENAAPDGFIGPGIFRTRNRWAYHIFFRAVLAQYAISGEVRYRDALLRHYRSVPHPMVSSRDVSGAEILLALHADTGDADLLQMATELYARFNEQATDRDADFSVAGMLSDKPVTTHGVTFNELAKLGALMFAATGDANSLVATVNAYDKVAAGHILSDGLHSSAERMEGRDALASHESCNIADYTWSLGRLAEVTGETRYADRAERVILNALPGAVTKDFSAVQYFSCPNQLVATSTSNHNLMSRGDNRMSFRPGHPVQCCTGNIQRAMPNYVEHLWMRGVSDDREIVAMMFGPSSFEGPIAGGQVTIEQVTGYPFEQEIAFEVTVDQPRGFSFGIRLPEWCNQPTVSVNDSPVNGDLTPGSIFHIDREWRTGDRVNLELPFELSVQQWPDEGVSVHLGPLTMSLPVSGTPQVDDIDDWERTPVEFRLAGPQRRLPGFPAYSVEPEGSWAYALAVNADDIATTATVEWCQSTAFPFDTDQPAVLVHLPARRVRGWDLNHPEEVTRALPSFVDGRFQMVEKRVAGNFTLTPPLPSSATLKDRLSDDVETITLVPYGNTLLRLTVFPDGHDLDKT